jgi:hypothetical protein
MITEASVETKSGRRNAFWVTACLIIMVLGTALLAWGAEDNENSTPTGWWYYTGQTLKQVKNTVNNLNARIITHGLRTCSKGRRTSPCLAMSGSDGRFGQNVFGIQTG